MRKRIALIDDDAGIQHMLVHVLESEQYEVVLTRTGSDAVSTGSPSLGILPRLSTSGKDKLNALGYWNLSLFRHKGRRS